MTSGQAFPVAPSMFKFQQHGQSGGVAQRTAAAPGKIVDDIAIVKSVHTEAINHDPAITFIQTGARLPGRAEPGRWLSYGLGSENENLPAFVVHDARPGRARENAGAVRPPVGSGLPADASTRAWHFAARATRCCISRIRRASIAETRRSMLDALDRLNQQTLERSRRSRNRRRASPSTKWPSACRRRCRN